jgi:predicted ribosome quality control (RQC) complex YloA/Tae2 family protein
MAMADYFGAPVGADAYTAGKGRIREQLADALDRLRRKLAALEREQSDAAEIEDLRRKGELLLAYASTIASHSAQFKAQYDPDGPPLVIALDPTLTAVENARAYFDRYEKAKRAAADLPALEQSARREVEYLEQLGVDLDLAASWPEIDSVREALQEGGYWRGKRTRGPRGGRRPGIRRFTTDEGFVILVGRNAAQNHQLITERSAPADLWLHARNLPGSHVIVKNDGRPVREHVIQYAAQLAATYSAGRDNAIVEVDVTERRYVRPIKGGKPGQVTYRNERTLVVRPGKPDRQP